MPALSVLLPVRDAGPYLASSLSSLWRQTFADFEVVAVDDGSTDGSGERLERAARQEPRLRVFHTAARGLPAALNLALARSRAPLVARHDADDLSHRERFRLQLEYLRVHRRVTVLGTRLRLFPARAVRPGMRRWAAWHNQLIQHESMSREVLIDSPLAHGTALMRRGGLERAGGWAERGWAEDLDLWVRLLDAGARFAKLPRVLYAWRQHPASATWRDPAYSRERFLALKCEAVERRFQAPRPASLVGTGESLRAWERALARRGDAVQVLAHKRPPPPGRVRDAALAALPRPIVLVFGAPVARARWREALAGLGLAEGRDFIFVA